MTKTIKDNLVVTLDYTLIVEDEILESTEDGEKIKFIQGIGQIIPGLENALYDMKVGEKKTVVIEPDDAYGDYDPESLEIAQKEEFSEEIPLDVGTFLDLRDDEDNVLSAQIIEADEDTITLDFNHPLAGKTLTFEITVADLRPASEEELEHGHVHEELIINSSRSLLRLREHPKIEIAMGEYAKTNDRSKYWRLLSHLQSGCSGKSAIHRRTKLLVLYLQDQKISTEDC